MVKIEDKDTLRGPLSFQNSISPPLALYRLQPIEIDLQLARQVFSPRET